MYVLNPAIFDELEWKCFYSLYSALDKDDLFLNSKEYLEFQDIDRFIYICVFVCINVTASYLSCMYICMYVCMYV